MFPTLHHGWPGYVSRGREWRAEPRAPRGVRRRSSQPGVEGASRSATATRAAGSWRGGARERLRSRHRGRRRRSAARRSCRPTRILPGGRCGPRPSGTCGSESPSAQVFTEPGPFQRRASPFSCRRRTTTLSRSGGLNIDAQRYTLARSARYYRPAPMRSPRPDSAFAVLRADSDPSLFGITVSTVGRTPSQCSAFALLRTAARLCDRHVPLVYNPERHDPWLGGTT